jgi:hypothetical protein
MLLQYAAYDVEKMILGTICDMEGKGRVSRVQGEAVSHRSYVIT